MSKRLAFTGFVFLLGASFTAGAQPSENPFHATGDGGCVVP